MKHLSTHPCKDHSSIAVHFGGEPLDVAVHRICGFAEENGKPIRVFLTNAKLPHWSLGPPEIDLVKTVNVRKSTPPGCAVGLDTSPVTRKALIGLPGSFVFENYIDCSTELVAEKMMQVPLLAVLDLQANPQLELVSKDDDEFGGGPVTLETLRWAVSPEAYRRIGSGKGLLLKCELKPPGTIETWLREQEIDCPANLNGLSQDEARAWWAENSADVNKTSKWANVHLLRNSCSEAMQQVYNPTEQIKELRNRGQLPHSVTKTLSDWEERQKERRCGVKHVVLEALPKFGDCWNKECFRALDADIDGVAGGMEEFFAETKARYVRDKEESPDLAPVLDAYMSLEKQLVLTDAVEHAAPGLETKLALFDKLRWVSCVAARACQDVTGLQMAYDFKWIIPLVRHALTKNQLVAEHLELIETLAELLFGREKAGRQRLVKTYEFLTDLMQKTRTIFDHILEEGKRQDASNPTGASSPTKPCFEFQKHGRCRFGERCWYKHDI